MTTIANNNHNTNWLPTEFAVAVAAKKTTVFLRVHTIADGGRQVVVSGADEHPLL